MLNLIAPKRKKKIPLYMDYLFFGTIISCTIDIFRDDKYCLFQMTYIFFVMLIYGANFSFTIFVKYVKNYWILTLSFFIWIVRGAIIGLPLAYIVRTFSFYLLIFGGFLYGEKYEEEYMENSLKRLVYLISLLTIVGMIWFFTNNNPIRHLSANAYYYVSVTNRLISIWLHPIPASCFICIAIILTYTVLKDNKMIFWLLGILGLLFTETRSAWLAMLIILMTAFTYVIVSGDNTKLKSSTIKRFIIALGIIIVLLIVFNQRVNEILDLISHRLFGQQMKNDISYLWRINSIFLMVGKVFDSNISSIILGHGLFQGGKLISSTNLSYKFAYNIGTIDNNYVSILYDFGLLGVVLMIVSIIITMKGIFGKGKSNVSRNLSFCMLFLLMLAFFFEELYWFGIAFVYYTFLGILLGINSSNNKIVRE